MRRLLFSFLVVLAAFTPAAASPGGDLRLGSGAVAWLPAARSNVAVVEWHDHVYVMGGSGLQGPAASVYDYNPNTRRFNDLAPLPTPRFGHGAVVCGSRILVFGGLRDATTFEDGIEAFDLDTKTWSKAGTMPFARGRFGLAALGGRVWMAGGSSASGRTAELQAYDPIKGTWERRADLPQACDRLALVALQGMLYAIGGETDDGKATTHVYRYDPATDHWTKMPSLAHARKNCAAARLGSCIVVAGGANIIDDAKTFIAPLEVYDPQKRDWLPSGFLETPRDGCRIAAWRGHLLIVGGFDGETLSSVEEAGWYSLKSRWTIDPATKLALGSLPQEPVPGGTGFTEERPLPVPPPLPSIVRLEPQTAEDLGMTPPNQGAPGLPLFIEVFGYPRQLAQETSARRIAEPFQVSSQAGWGSVAFLLKSPMGIMVSEGLFAPPSTTFGPKNPFPTLQVPNETVEGVSPQEWFDRSLHYAVLFVRSVEPPGGPPLEASAAGAAALSAEALAILGRDYRPISGPDARFAYFLDDSETDQAGSAPRCSLVRVQKTPTLLTNWREIPLASDPLHLFQSALLRLICDDMVGPQGPDATGVADLKGKTVRTLVLQVSSAYRVP